MAKMQPRNVSTFRASHDRNVIVPNKIKAALDAIRNIGPEHYEYEADFLRLAGISTTDLAMFRDQFTAHIVETVGTTKSRNPKRVYFGDPKVAAKLRGA